MPKSPATPRDLESISSWRNQWHVTRQSETGTHSAYLQLHFLKDIDEVSAVGAKVKHSVYDEFIALLHTRSQAIGTIEVSWLAKKLEVVFELAGSDGRKVQILDFDFFTRYPGKRPTRIVQGLYWDLKAVAKKWAKFLQNNIYYRHVLLGLPQYILINKYIDSIRNDTDPPVKPEDGRNSIALLECIEKSLNKNEPVKMKAI
jgi:predicted dehydrogenase